MNKLSKRSIDLLAEDFLRANDPEYNKRSKPYKSHRQQRRYLTTEIPFSNLSYNQRKRCGVVVGDGEEIIDTEGR